MKLDKIIRGKCNWAEKTFANIDWRSIEIALKGRQGLAKTTIIKRMHQWQQTNEYVQHNERKSPSKAKCLAYGAIDDQ